MTAITTGITQIEGKDQGRIKKIILHHPHHINQREILHHPHRTNNWGNKNFYPGTPRKECVKSN
jgi:hypothetical protein